MAIAERLPGPPPTVAARARRATKRVAGRVSRRSLPLRNIRSSNLDKDRKAQE